MEDVEWEYPLVSDAPEAAGIFPIKEYIQIRRATISAQVVCQTIWMYSLIGNIPTASGASDTRGYSHSTSSIHRSVIYVILPAAWWWKPSNTFSILPSPPKSIYHTVVPYATPLYRAPHGTAPLLLSSSVPLESPPRVAEPSIGCDTRPPNSYYYMQCWEQGKERTMQVLTAPHCDLSIKCCLESVHGTCLRASSMAFRGKITLFSKIKFCR